MNTTPSMRDSGSSTSSSYTVIGGQRKNRQLLKSRANTLLILNRGQKIYRNEDLEEYSRYGFDEILSIEPPGINLDFETLALKFPKVRFLLLKDRNNIGEQINLGIEEARGNCVFVIWNDMRLSTLISSRVFDHIKKDERLCTLPLIQNKHHQTIPSLIAPALYKRTVKTVFLPPKNDGMISLYPFDFSGVYNREKFKLLGGFDPLISTPYWQRMDFGFRAYMWGEEFRGTTGIRLYYTEEDYSDDLSVNEDYKRFFLKNLLVRYLGDSGKIPLSRFFQYHLHSRGGLIHEWKTFQEVRKWVDINTYRYTQDAKSVTELWEVPDQ